jgi:metal-sulfur cluster biosynthetic enzyme
MVTEEQIVEELKKVIDPHTNISVYDMGLISNLRVENDNVTLTFVPSSPYCPLGIQLAFAIKQKIKEIKDVKSVEVKVEGHVQEEQLNKMLKNM